MKRLDTDEDISRHIWQTRYRQEGEASLSDSWRRLARAIAGVEPARNDYYHETFFQFLEGGTFVPGGRILAGAGTGRQTSLANCFVMHPFKDSFESVFDALYEAAETLAQGGGIGCDFSSLLPKGTRRNRSPAIAPGPVAYLHLWERMCDTLLAAGHRRGAIMANLRCDHPDITKFIEAKAEPGVLTHFNLSVLVTDAFMTAVVRDEFWELRAPHGAGAVASSPLPIGARSLWTCLMHAAYGSSEPGVLFIDRINRTNNLGYCETISATNPCGEIPLPAYGACHLGSINLCRLVREPFGRTARIDDDALRHTVRLAVRLLDNVIDLSAYPMEQQRQQALLSRRVGLGIMGLADTLIMLGLKYDDERARNQAEVIMKAVREEAVRASIALAEERGSFALFDREHYLARPMIEALPADLRDGIALHGLRNSHLTAIAPTGTISLLADAVSSGLEPLFAGSVHRTVRQHDGSLREFQYDPYSVRVWRACGHEGLPSAIRVADEISPRDQLLMQAALQRHVDNAISKTVAVARDCTLEAFSKVYELAYTLGVKGCAVFRPGGSSAPEGVLTKAQCTAPGLSS